jgi:hypothetical protein
MATAAKIQGVSGFSPYVLALREAMDGLAGKPILRFQVGDLAAEVRAMAGSVWVLLRREGRGGLALRAAYVGDEFECTTLKDDESEIPSIRVTGALGEHRIALVNAPGALDRLRVTVKLTPSEPLLIPILPRDLYPLDENGDPTRATGRVEAVQRGLNAGIVYFRVEQPAFGNVLYFQNLTASNKLYLATGTTPDGAVGGLWPELGYLVPSSQQSDAPPDKPLPAGEEVTLSDAILVIGNDAPADERGSARRFIQMLGAAYQMLQLPPTEYHDWIERAERTIRDLENAPEATIRHYGHRYVHPYTAAEYPDIMVQMSLVAALHDWSKWSGQPHPLEAELKAGLGKFYDPKLKTIRRYLPNVGKDKDADAVDSWYLYHPMLNLGILALDGDEDARKLFLGSLDYGIKSAHHFEYKWPIQYKITDFSVITENAADGRGQTDVGGIYAWVMLQAFELTDDKRYLDEARAAIDAAIGLRFDINYQANLTAWGAAACMRLWRITNRDVYLEQSYVYLGSFFHNSAIWESEIGHASAYSNFLGVTCLQDAPYMAVYECFDSYAAFERYLDDSGPDLEPAARMLISEYCKYALSRAWYYYPDALPPEAIAKQQRESNGFIDPKLSFPLEDLYVDGREAGQVGQEIYGAGAAMVFATRTYHRVEGVPFTLFCNHFIRSLERTGERTLSITLDGGETCTADLSIIRLKRRRLPKTSLMTVGGDAIRPRENAKDRVDYHVPASGNLILTWE